MLTPDETGDWHASLSFFDDGWCQPEATQGALRTRYFDQLDVVADTLIADAGRLGIVWKMRQLYVPGDGNDPDCPLPDGWRAMLKALAERIGFDYIYEDSE